MAEEKTILDFFLDNVEKFGDRTFMTQPMGGGDSNIKTYSFNETLDEAKKMAGYIQSLGLPEKSQIAILSKNCAWWVIADLAIMMTGNVSVPIFPALTAETTRYTLEHSESKMVFIGKLDDKPWQEQKNGIPKELPSVRFPLCPEDHGATEEKSWDDIISSTSPIAELVKRTKDEMATIIYTSGSTGKPKGVMTSFKAMTDTTKGLVKTLTATDKDRWLSYLPIAHGMERWCGEMVPMYTGMYLYFAESLKLFSNDLSRSRPTVFLSVPRLYTKFQAAVFTKMPEKKLNRLLKIPLINFLVKRKLLKALGLDKARIAGTGSAPMPPDLIEWYRNLGLELLEGYGMTENFNYSHLSRPGKTRVGYVGHVHEGAECKIDESNGEILVKGPGTMMGYFKNEEETNKTITIENGEKWVRTGDKGEIDSEGRLKITGRTKEIFKTSKGKYVAPAPIEGKIVSNHLIELACVSGRAQPQPHVIVQLSEGPKERAGKSAEERSAMEKELEEHFTKVNSELDGHEKLDFLVVVKDDWLPENGFLTPTQKMKRNTIEDEYSSNVEEWYNQKKKFIWHGEW